MRSYLSHSFQLHAVISNTFISHARLKLAKNQAEFDSQFMKKLNKTEAELKKGVAYKISV